MSSSLYQASSSNTPRGIISAGSAGELCGGTGSFGRSIKIPREPAGHPRVSTAPAVPSSLLILPSHHDLSPQRLRAVEFFNPAPVPSKRDGVPVSSALANGHWRMNRNHPAQPLPKGIPVFRNVKLGEIFFLGSVSPLSNSIIQSFTLSHVILSPGDIQSWQWKHFFLRACTQERQPSLR